VMRSYLVFFFSSRRRHTRFSRDWSSDVCSSDLTDQPDRLARRAHADGDFRAQRHKIEILAEGVGTEARTLVRTVEPDFLTHQASADTHRDAGKGCTAVQRM